MKVKFASLDEELGEEGPEDISIAIDQEKFDKQSIIIDFAAMFIRQI